MATAAILDWILRKYINCQTVERFHHIWQQSMSSYVLLDSNVEYDGFNDNQETWISKSTVTFESSEQCSLKLVAK